MTQEKVYTVKKWLAGGYTEMGVFQLKDRDEAYKLHDELKKTAGAVVLECGYPK